MITSASCIYSDTKIINKDKVKRKKRLEGRKENVSLFCVQLVASLGLQGEKRVVGVAKVLKHSHYWQGKNSGKERRRGRRRRRRKRMRRSRRCKRRWRRRHN